MDKEHGVGVMRIKEFNIAMMGRWCCRMVNDRGGIWFRVLAARYGVEEGQLKEGEREVSV